MMREGDYDGRRRPPLLISCIHNLCTTISSCLYFFCCCWLLEDRYGSYSPLGRPPPGGPAAPSTRPPGLLHVGPPLNYPRPLHSVVGPTAAPFGIPGAPPGLPGPLAPPPPF